MDLNIYNLGNLNNTFWSGGNAPTQKVLHLDEEEVLLHLKASFLLSDKIIAAASFYFESIVTRQVVDQMWPIFKRGEILFFIDEELEDYTEHGIAKIEKSPTNLCCYRDKESIKVFGNILDSIGHVLRRPSQSISDKIAEQWTDDINSISPGTIGFTLKEMCKNFDSLHSIKLKLIQLAIKRDKDFVWEYIQPYLVQLNMPFYFQRIVRKRLSQFYSIATSELLQAKVDRDDSVFINQDSRFDSGIFINCLEVLGVVDSFRNLGPLELIKLKSTFEFQLFREFYFSMMESVTPSISEVQKWTTIYRHSTSSYAKNAVSRDIFLDAFEHLCKLLNRPSKKYSRPLDFLLSVFDITSKLIIDEFKDILFTIARKRNLLIDSTDNSHLNDFRSTNQIGSEVIPMIKILFFTANPDNTGKLHLDREAREIDQRLRLSEYRDRFDLEKDLAVRVNDIQGCLLRHRPKIVHFAGHGNASGEIILEDDSGLATPVNQKALQELFALFTSTVRCVVLNCCYSESQARAIAKVVDFVIGVSNTIEDEAAINFASGFYEALGYGESLGKAFKFGCNRIDLKGLAEANHPKLIALRGIDADSIKLF